MNDQGIKADGIVEALRAISTKNSISTYKRSVCKDAAALIENQAARLAAVTAERDAAVESWRGFCAKCDWNGKQYLSDGKMDDRCKTCQENNKCNWKWRGRRGPGRLYDQRNNI